MFGSVLCTPSSENECRTVHSHFVLQRLPNCLVSEQSFPNVSTWKLLRQLTPGSGLVYGMFREWLPERKSFEEILRSQHLLHSFSLSLAHIYPSSISIDRATHAKRPSMTLTMFTIRHYVSIAFRVIYKNYVPRKELFRNCLAAVRSAHKLVIRFPEKRVGTRVESEERKRETRRKEE